MSVDDTSQDQELLRTLLDEERLQVIGLLAVKPQSVTEIAQTLNLDTGTVRHHIRRLRRAGLLINRSTHQNSLYELNSAGIQQLKQALFASQEPAATTNEERVMRAFVKNNRLEQIPTKQTKLLVVLDWLCQQFDANRTYPESEVKEIINRYHPDHATLRRLLVDFGYMTRDQGVYRRVTE
jgi:biotin operon repressor